MKCIWDKLTTVSRAEQARNIYDKPECDVFHPPRTIVKLSKLVFHSEASSFPIHLFALMCWTCEMTFVPRHDVLSSQTWEHNWRKKRREKTSWSSCRRSCFLFRFDWDIFTSNKSLLIHEFEHNFYSLLITAILKQCCELWDFISTHYAHLKKDLVAVVSPEALSLKAAIMKLHRWFLFSKYVCHVSAVKIKTLPFDRLFLCAFSSFTVQHCLYENRKLHKLIWREQEKVAENFFYYLLTFSRTEKVELYDRNIILNCWQNETVFL